jgi:alpha-mannosidase
VGEDVQDHAFLWRAPSGAEVLVGYLATSYSNAAGLPPDPAQAGRRVREAVAELGPFVAVPVYLLMNGSDHLPPRPGTGRAPALVDPEWEGGRVRVSSLPEYFAELRRALGAALSNEARAGGRRLAVVTGELRSGRRAPVLAGTLSARLRQKQRNQRVESLLSRKVEPASAMAWLLGALPYPTAELDYAWRLLLKNHPHDSICGCSLDVVHREMETRFDKVEQVGRGLLERAEAALDRCLRTEGTDLFVVNYSPVRRGGLVEAVVPDRGHRIVRTAAPGDAASAPAAARPAAGEEAGDLEIPCQEVAAGGEDTVFDLELSPLQLRGLLPLLPGREVLGMVVNEVRLSRPEQGRARIELVLGDREVGDLDMTLLKKEVRTLISDPTVKRVHVLGRRSRERRVVFLAEDVPGLGWRRYRVEAAPGGGPWAAAPRPARADRTAAGVTDGPEGPGLENDVFRVVVRPDGTLDVTDRRSGLTYPGLNRLTDGGDRGDLYTYCPPPEDHIVFRPVRRVKVRVVETGPVRATLEVSALYRLPPGLSADRRRRLRDRRHAVEMEVVTLVSLVAGEALVRLKTVFDNRALDHRLQAVFPVPRPFESHYALSHFSVVERPAVEPVGDGTAWAERPSGTWPHRGFFGAGELTVFAPGLPEYAVVGRGEGLALTLVRSVGWLSRDDLENRPGRAGPGVATPEGQCPGRHELEYALSVHPGDWREAGATDLLGRLEPQLLCLSRVGPSQTGSVGAARSGDEGNGDPEVRPVGPDGTLRETGGLLELRVLEAERPDAVVVTAVKKSFERPGHGETSRLVVRLTNLSPTCTTVLFKPGAGTDLGPPERLDLAERLVGGEKAGPSWKLRLDPWELVTVGLPAASAGRSGRLLRRLEG